MALNPHSLTVGSISISNDNPRLQLLSPESTAPVSSPPPAPLPASLVIPSSVRETLPRPARLLPSFTRTTHRLVPPSEMDPVGLRHGPTVRSPSPQNST
ncbi:hypothetical protein CKAH01_01638 [Colletotrichum kahawae]|uniref:Uncharacterized protein n=1 Tax=Colletotrichum kahawae TaxID=34407 RepID=A0AAD9Y817_COLKA|nr:hypothetical protein CKAH01_01638 [Colletotrichum kahawae]